MLSNFRSDLESLNGLEADSIRTLCYELPSGYQDCYRTYEYTRLCTITQGEKCISVDNKILKYDSKKILILPSQAKIGMKIYKPTKAIVYELNNIVIDRVSEEICNDYSLNLSFFLNEKFYLGSNNFDELLSKIRTELCKENRSDFIIDLYTQELVYHLIQNEAIKQLLLDNNNAVNKAIRYMNSNYMKPVCIKEIAYNLGMSESGLCQYFKKITGISPNKYFTKIKLEKAKEMLKDISVTDTAFNLGYLNISYFIAIFKKMYGLTPKQYKMKIHNIETIAE